MPNTSITYKNPGDTLKIIQITSKELKKNPHCLKTEDLGRWVFIMKGLYYGFFHTREEAEARVDNLMSD